MLYDSLCHWLFVRTLTILRKNRYNEMMKCHVSKISRLISKKFDIHKHTNMSSYHLSFFEKLVIHRVLKFSLLQKVSPIEIQASFEKAYWKTEPLLKDPDKKEWASSTLRSIALNYIQRSSPNPPKALVKAVNRLKKHDDIIITKPDKGSGVVVMDKSDLKPVADHQIISIHFCRKKKSYIQLYNKYFQRKLLIHFPQTVPGWLICMTFPSQTQYEAYSICNWII